MSRVKLLLVRKFNNLDYESCYAQKNILVVLFLNFIYLIFGSKF